MCESPTTPDNGEVDKSSNIFQNGRRQKHHDPARDISIQVLEKFSLVTRFARETTSQLFGDSQYDSYPSNARLKDGALSPASKRITSSDDAPRVRDEVPVAADPVEVVIYHFTSCLCF